MFQASPSLSGEGKNLSSSYTNRILSTATYYDNSESAKGKTFISEMAFKSICGDFLSSIGVCRVFPASPTLTSGRMKITRYSSEITIVCMLQISFSFDVFDFKRGHQVRLQMRFVVTSSASGTPIKSVLYFAPTCRKRGARSCCRSRFYTFDDESSPLNLCNNDATRAPSKAEEKCFQFVYFIYFLISQATTMLVVLEYFYGRKRNMYN